MMRRPLTVLASMCLGWFASSSVLATVWSIDAGVVTSRIGDARIETKHDADVRAVSARDDGSAWIADADALWLVSQDGHVRAEIDLAGTAFGHAELVAANAYDGSVWATTDQLLLLHFAGNGVLEQGTTLATTADAMAIDLDESVWVAANDRLLHFSSDGQWLGTQPLGLAADEHVTALARDALRERLWIATTGGLHLLVARGSWLDERIVQRGAVDALAIDPTTGVAMATVDGALVAVDADGDAPAVRSTELGESERPFAVVYDAADASFVVDTDKMRLRMASDGRLLDGERAREGLLLAATPFRLDPTLTLLRPPDGGAVMDRAAEIVLRVGALCNGNRCALPPAYLRGLRVEAALDGVALDPPIVDEAGRALVSSHAVLHPGVNELTASFIDMFGHRATLAPARWTLIAGDQSASVPLSRMQPGATVDKAANKAPTVALTQPSNGSVVSVGTAIRLVASASDADGTIAKVEFYRGGTTLIGAATSSPYQFVWVFGFHMARRSSPTRPMGLAYATPAPDFTLEALDGKNMSLSDLRGKAVLLNFWATWCSPCKVEMPWFVELQQEYGSQGLQIVGVAMDDSSKEDIAKFAKDMGVNYPVLLGKEAVGDAYGGVPALPESFFIGRDGKIVDKIIGLRGKGEIEDSIRKALNTPAGSSATPTASAAQPQK